MLFEVVHLHAQGGVWDRGFVFLWHVKLALLLETRACGALTQGLEGRPMLGELLRDTFLGRDGRVGGCAAASGRRRGLGCGLLGAVVLLQEVPCKRLSVQRGGASHVVGSWMSLPGSQTC